MDDSRPPTSSSTKPLAPLPPKPTQANMSLDFWDRHFGTDKKAQWVDFKDHFLVDYGDRIADQFGADKEKFAVHLIYNDIFELHKVVDKATYTRFCGRNTKADPHLFFNRLKDYAVGSFAMREVFNMDSSVRLTAIRNLGKLRFFTDLYCSCRYCRM